ncbi:hypothetical protein SLS60_007438 [Paraconiothyrium brasiliense]|uniref:Uncharacterized protein n=1 Tax=Paraconiothyrium brasiliense TaxID=300254 RepID=A0ABR3R5C5_9PLEO
MKVLLSKISAFPQLANALPEFGASDVPTQGSRTFFNSEHSLGTKWSGSHEFYVLLKYVEPNGNKSDPIPWSIRQQLFYQSFDASCMMENCVTIRPSQSFRRKIIDQFMETSGVSCHWTNLPMVLVGSLNAHWSAYARFLEEEIWKVDKSIGFTDPFSETLGEANFRTLSETKQYYDLLVRAQHALNSNIRVLQLLLKESIKRFSQERETSGEQFFAHYTILEGVTNDVIEESYGLVAYFDSLKVRLCRTTEAIRDSITLRSTYHAAVESQNMKRLTQKSVQEARTVKAIALVTLVYLPATFVAASIARIP